MAEDTFHYYTPDGNELVGTADECVEQMSMEKFDAPKSLESYRHATARRVNRILGNTQDATTDRVLIDPSTSQSFLDTLAHNHLLSDTPYD